jgi:adenylyltransferase/sulfurtransferase
MNPSSPPVVNLSGGRFARFESISWWKQSLLRDARVLVVGAGALGNELVKNLALLGIGHLAILDRDEIEESNLCRSVLFRSSDEGRPKAAVAARAAREIYPEMEPVGIRGSLAADLGVGYVRWAQVVVGCLDNREARVFLNRICALAARPWLDGGIDVLGGIVRGFRAPATACYECTMGKTDWDLLAARRSCSLLARQAHRENGVPTTPTTASVIGAIQAQEVVKLLHGMDALVGRGYVFEGATHNSYRVDYRIAPDCPWHEAPADIEECPQFNSATSLSEMVGWARDRLGGCDALDLARELVQSLECTRCQRVESVFRPPDTIGTAELTCADCGEERTPRVFHSVAAGSQLLQMSARQLGLPQWDVLWARYQGKTLGIELSGDRRIGA